MTKPYSVVVHLQTMDDDGELAGEIDNSGKDIGLSVVYDLMDDFPGIHSKENHYPDWALNWMRQNKGNPRFTWFQEGYRHWCERCNGEMQDNILDGKGRQPDPFHEYVCADGRSSTFNEIIQLLDKGKEGIEDKLGIKINNHCSPNHLDNEDVLEALKVSGYKYHLTRNGFDYFLPGVITLPAYEYHNLIILPETQPQFNTSPIKMFYYDRIGKNDKTRRQFFNSLENSVPISELNIKNNPPMHSNLNRGLIRKYKQLRNFSKRLKG